MEEKKESEELITGEWGQLEKRKWGIKGGKEHNGKQSEEGKTIKLTGEKSKVLKAK